MHFLTLLASGHKAGLCPPTSLVCGDSLKSRLHFGVPRRDPLCPHLGALSCPRAAVLQVGPTSQQPQELVRTARSWAPPEVCPSEALGRGPNHLGFLGSQGLVECTLVRGTLGRLFSPGPTPGQDSQGLWACEPDLSGWKAPQGMPGCSPG